MTSNNGVNVQHEADNRKYFATNNSNVLLKTTLSKSNVNSTFTRLPSNSWIVIDLNTWIWSMWNNKISLYNAIKDINWWIWSPRQMNGNNASFGINNNVSLWGRYKISDYLTEAQFNNTTNLKLFYKSSTEIWVFHWTLANIGIANYGTDQTKHSVNNLRQQSSTALWWTLQNWYLYLNDTFGKVIYFDNNGIGFLDKSLLSNYSWRWIPYLDWWNYYWSGANRLVFGDNNWSSVTNNTVKWWINTYFQHFWNWSDVFMPVASLNHVSWGTYINFFPQNRILSPSYQSIYAIDYDLWFVKMNRTNTYYYSSFYKWLDRNSPEITYSFFPLY